MLAVPTVVGAQSDGALWPSGISECLGQIAIVVASDLAAQSDVYSAVTLAGVVDSDCLVDAGARDEPLPAASVAMLDIARSGAFVVGGTAAVPDEKLHGRSVYRVAGKDRWATARAAGQIANDLAAGKTPTFVLIDASTATEAEVASIDVAGRGWLGCAILTDGALTCWHRTVSDTIAIFNPPVQGPFIRVTGNTANGCAVRVDRTLTCWRYNYDTAAFEAVDAPFVGEFIDMSGSGWYGCAIRESRTLICWGDRSGPHSRGKSVDSPVEGEFTAVVGNAISGCAFRVVRALVCWGTIDFVHEFLEMPVEGEFIDLSGSGWGVCAVRIDHSLVCWRPYYDDGVFEVVVPPLKDEVTDVSGNGVSGCAIRLEGTLVCWQYDPDSKTVEVVDLPT